MPPPIRTATGRYASAAPTAPTATVVADAPDAPPVCPSCSEPLEGNEGPTDDECSICTTQAECRSCDEWHDPEDLTPDNECEGCTSMHRCDDCSAWVDYLEHDDRCEECTTYTYCGRCDEAYDTDDYGSCPSCYEDDECADGHGAGDTSPVNAARLEAVRAPALRCAMAIGIELEGGWHTPPRDDHLLTEDCSVNVVGRYRSGAEMPSPILEPGQWATVRDFIGANYPHRVGPSCGMHVHFSFGNRDATEYAAKKIRTQRFSDYVVKRLKAWGKRYGVTNKSFWRRLEGENEFCRLHVQAPDDTGHRYNAVNFNSLPRHGTVEIRVLAAFYNPTTALAVIAELVRIMERACAPIVDRYVIARDVIARATVALKRLEQRAERARQTISATARRAHNVARDAYETAEAGNGGRTTDAMWSTYNDAQRAANNASYDADAIVMNRLQQRRERLDAGTDRAISAILIAHNAQTTLARAA